MPIAFQSHGPGYFQVSGVILHVYFLTDLINTSRTDSELFFLLEGEGNVNPQGVEYYNNLINYMLQQGTTAFLNRILISGAYTSTDPDCYCARHLMLQFDYFLLQFRFFYLKELKQKQIYCNYAGLG